MEKLFTEVADKIYQQGDEIDPSIINALSNIINHKKTGGFRLRENVLDPDAKIVSRNEDKNSVNYGHYCSLYSANVMLLEKIKDTLSHKEDLVSKLRRIRESSEQVLTSMDESQSNRKKRHRRSAQEVERHFNCPIQKCDKSYGSEGSLNQHIKHKHLKYWNKYYVSKGEKGPSKNTDSEDTPSFGEKNGSKVNGSKEKRYESESNLSSSELE